LLNATARRNALFLIFALPGITISSWVTRTPDIRDLLGASTAVMGLVLAGLSVGSMIGILLSGSVVARFGTRPVIFTGLVFVSLGAALIATGSMLESEWLVAAGLASFGFGMGGSEVAINVEGAAVEGLLGKSTMPIFHGFYSLGTAVGAAIGLAFAAFRVPVALHLVIVAVAVLAALIAGIRYVPKTAPGKEKQPQETKTSTADAPWRDPRLLLIGFIVLALAMAEGTANDWLPLIMVDGHGLPAALGSAVFVIFAIAMTVGRFIGGYIVDRFGTASTLAASAFVGVLGTLLVSAVNNQPVAIAAVALWGLGASLGFPVALSAAGQSGPNPARRVALAATLGYVAFLVGPPLLGFVGEEIGLRGALLIVVGLIVCAGFASLTVGRLTRQEEQVNSS
jgi:fucose permease